MPRQRLRLKTPTIARSVREGKQDAFLVPAGAEIEVLDNLDVDFHVPTRFVKVEWNSQTIEMFAIDIRERGERVK